jgi:regulator of extracellular matrix RemA (YlzA/DUF370 family)
MNKDVQADQVDAESIEEQAEYERMRERARLRYLKVKAKYGRKPSVETWK